MNRHGYVSMVLEVYGTNSRGSYDVGVLRTLLICINYQISTRVRSCPCRQFQPGLSPIAQFFGAFAYNVILQKEYEMHEFRQTNAEEFAEL